MNQLLDLFEIMRKESTDINEHMEYLRELVRNNRLSGVVEFGVRDGNSTIALLAGFPDWLVSVDIVEDARLARVKDAYLRSPFPKPAWQIILADDMAIEIPACDLLFIDTQHTSRQLRKELTKHSPKCKRFIAIHDTESFKDFDAFFNEEGLGRALQEFITTQSHTWQVEKVFTHNNGMTVLRRK